MVTSDGCYRHHGLAEEEILYGRDPFTCPNAVSLGLASVTPAAGLVSFNILASL